MPLWAEHDAGHLALDLVNTVSWRGDPARRRDRLDGPAALAEWTAGHSLPTVADATPRDLAELRALREAIHTVVLARTANRADAARHDAGAEAADGTDSAGLRVAAAARAAVGRARLDLADGARWAADPSSARGLLDHLALAALDLLATADPTRLRRCGDHDCGWLFHDTSRSGTRTWCSSDCGNRVRARRHHNRRKAHA